MSSTFATTHVGPEYFLIEAAAQVSEREQRHVHHSGHLRVSESTGTYALASEVMGQCADPARKQRPWSQ